MKNPMKKLMSITVLASLFMIPVLTASAQDADVPVILGLKEQTAVTALWLKPRLETILPEVMRREKTDMWIVMSRENNQDPVYSSLTGREVSRRLSILVFFDRGKEGIERMTVSYYNIGPLYKQMWNQEKESQWESLTRVVRERDPKTIGINESATFATADGLTASLGKKLAEAIGSRYASRMRSAEGVAVSWLATRSAAELEAYPHIISIAQRIILEAFSNRVIMPGVTTTRDVEWWIMERIRGLGLSKAFTPGVHITRYKEGEPEDIVIRRGDVVHCDMGIAYLGLHTDHKETVYILKEGESDVPQGLKDALARLNKVQEILTGEFRLGRKGNEILASALQKAREQGFKTAIYCHPLGVHLHGAGSEVGLWDQQGGVPGMGDFPLYADTSYAIEFEGFFPLPEWDNEEVELRFERETVFDGERVVFFFPRQEEIHLVR